MQFGAAMPSLGRYARGGEAAEAQRIIAQRAEALGFDSLWTGDHVILPAKLNQRYPYTESGDYPIPLDTPFLEPLTYLAYIAGVTTRIRLGTSVLVLPHRNPIVTAKVLATIDVLSGGRTIVGAGVGYMEQEITLLGWPLTEPFKNRGVISDEYVQAMRELWSSPNPVFEGQFVSFRDIKFEPKPVQSPLPLWFGGHSRRMMRRVAESGDGCIFAAGNLEQFKVQHAMLVEEADRRNRDINSIKRVILLAGAYSIKSSLTEIDRYMQLGMDYFIINLTSWGSSLPEYFSALTEFAERVGLKPASANERPLFSARE